MNSSGDPLLRLHYDCFECANLSRITLGHFGDPLLRLAIFLTENKVISETIKQTTTKPLVTNKLGQAKELPKNLF